MSHNVNRPAEELTKDVIESLKAKGYNQTEIARMFNVTRAAVSWHMRTYNGAKTPRQIVNEAWPWKTVDGHDKATVYRRLRDHGEFMQTGGVGISREKMTSLKNWWRKLRDENLVVEFDPNIPPIPGVASRGGFTYRERTIEDDDLLIRVNDYTDLADEGAMIWCWPPDIDEML